MSDVEELKEHIHQTDRQATQLYISLRRHLARCLTSGDQEGEKFYPNATVIAVMELLVLIAHTAKISDEELLISLRTLLDHLRGMELSMKQRDDILAHKENHAAN